MKHYLLRWGIILVLGLLIYGQTLGFGFVFDDHLFIVTNPYIKRFDSVTTVFQGFPLTRALGFYSFALNYALGGLNPFGYHLFNLLVHFIAVAFVWGIAGILFRLAGYNEKDLAYWVALIFLVHPGQTQAITYVTQRFESMATMFYLSSIYCYLRARIGGIRWQQGLFLLGSAASACLGILTKEIVATLPLMLLAIEWIFWPKNNKRVAILFGLCVLFWCAFWMISRTGTVVFLNQFPSESHDGDMITFKNYVLTQFRVLLTFLRVLIVPVRQCLEYDYPLSTGLFNPPLTLLGIIITLFLTIKIFSWRSKYPIMAIGIAWMLIAFSINGVPRSNVISEHKLYLLSIGFLLVAVGCLSRWVHNRQTRFKLVAVLVMTLAVVSFCRNRVWSNELILWEDIIKKSPFKSRANANLGRVYGNLNRSEEALFYLNRAIELNPQDTVSLVNRGKIYQRLNKSNQALADFSNAMTIEPSLYMSYVARADLYMSAGKDDLALADLNTAIKLEPLFTEPRIQQGILLLRQGRNAQALTVFDSVLSIAPHDNQALYYRDQCLSRIKR